MPFPGTSLSPLRINIHQHHLEHTRSLAPYKPSKPEQNVHHRGKTNPHRIPLTNQRPVSSPSHVCAVSVPRRPLSVTVTEPATYSGFLSRLSSTDTASRLPPTKCW